MFVGSIPLLADAYQVAPGATDLPAGTTFLYAEEATTVTLWRPDGTTLDVTMSAGNWFPLPRAFTRITAATGDVIGGIGT